MAFIEFFHYHRLVQPSCKEGCLSLFDELSLVPSRSGCVDLGPPRSRGETGEGVPRFGEGRPGTVGN